MRRGVGIVRVALAVLLAAGLVLLLPVSPAAACSCGMAEPVDAATLEEYDVVLTGEVRANEAVDQQRRELEVAVDQVFKGEAVAEQAVVTHAQSSACGTDPAVGSEVLFLMTRGPQIPQDTFATDDELVVMSCGGERNAEEAAALGAGRPPDEAAARDGKAGGSDSGSDGGIQGETDPGLWWWGVGAIGVLGAIRFGLLPRLRRRAGGGRPT